MRKDIIKAGLIISVVGLILLILANISWVVKNEVQVPYDLATLSGWSVKWYNMTWDGKDYHLWEMLGTSNFPSEFDKYWGWGEVYGGYSDHVGFEATAELSVSESSYITVLLGSDDFSSLEIYNYQTHFTDFPCGNPVGEGYNEDSATVPLEAGIYRIRIFYYEHVGSARIRFDYDSSIEYRTQTEYTTVHILEPKNVWEEAGFILCLAGISAVVLGSLKRKSEMEGKKIFRKPK